MSIRTAKIKINFMPVRIPSNWISHTVASGIQNDTVILENSFLVSYKN